MSLIKAVNKIKPKKLKIILSRRKYLVLNKFSLNTIKVDNIISIKLILIIMLPAIKLNGINDSNKLK